MAGKKSNGRPDANIAPHGKGTYIAYDANGEEIWLHEDFVIGEDKVPVGISIGMRAGMIVDAKSGEKIKKWDPDRLLK